MNTQNTHGAENPKLSHRDKYKMVIEQINLYQHEIHRTWLWAAMSAAAFYTWVELHKSDIVLPWYIWCIPPGLIAFCAFRYANFFYRIEMAGEIIENLEDVAFKNDKEFSGATHYNHVRQECFKKVAKWGALIIWGLMLLGSLLLSWLSWASFPTSQQAAKWDYKTISSTNDEILNTSAAQGWIPVSMSVTPDGNKWFLLKKTKE